MELCNADIVLKLKYEMDNKNSISESDSIYKIIKKMLAEQNISSYEPEVLDDLIAFAENYVTETIRKAKCYMEHANRKELDIADVKLAINENNLKIQKTKLPFKNLIELAKEHNQTKLPSIKEECNLYLPANALTNCNYKMLGATPKYAFNYSMVDTIRHGNMMPPNILRNAGSLSTIIRANGGASSLNLNPQRIVFKPQMNKNIDMGFDGNVKKRKTL